MKRSLRQLGKKREAGVALLLSIFVLLAISVVAISMIVASGTESSLAGNYRSGTSAYYAAMAGIEEGRGRLLSSNPNYLGTGLIPTAMAYNKVVYILNPASGESASTLLTTYPDNEYATEFGAAPSSGNVQTTTSIASLASGVSVPLYKWVRINPVTEKALNRDVNNDGTLDSTTPLYYDSGHSPNPSLIVSTTPPSTAQEVFEVTALAVLPNKSEKLLQYTTAARTYSLNFPSALTIPGQIGNFSGANSNPYHMNGNDGSGSAPAVSGCTTNSAAVLAIGLSAGNDAAGTQTNLAYVDASLPRPDHYSGSCGSTPCVGNVTLSGGFSSPAMLNQTISQIKSAANVVLQPNPLPANGVSTTNYGFSDVTTAMGGSWTNPSTNNQVIYVDGNFDLGPNTGSGILVVTGNFTYHGNSGWNGIILVVGDGSTTFDGLGGGNGEFDGAIMVATTRDSNGNQLSSFGTANFDISGGGGNGIYYNSCWINKANQPATYQILSFREIPYND
jgi:hypothetical protein